MPVYVTFRVTRDVCNLRSQRAFGVLKRVFTKAARRFDTRIIHFAVLGNHIHLLVESANVATLSRAMKGLGVRIARRMNRMMNRKGRVIDHRHHTSIVRTHRGARRVIRYIRENHRKHYGPPDEWRTGVSIDARSSWARVIDLPEPQTVILKRADPFS